MVLYLMRVIQLLNTGKSMLLYLHFLHALKRHRYLNYANNECLDAHTVRMWEIRNTLWMDDAATAFVGCGLPPMGDSIRLPMEVLHGIWLMAQVFLGYARKQFLELDGNNYWWNW